MAKMSLSNPLREIQAARRTGRSTVVAGALALGLFWSTQGAAAPLFVLASNMPSAAPIGTELDTENVTLPAGALVEVMSEAGDVFELSGPLDGPVDPAEAVKLAASGGLLTGGGIKVAPATSFFIAGTAAEQPAAGTAGALGAPANPAHFQNNKAKKAPARSADGITIIE